MNVDATNRQLLADWKNGDEDAASLLYSRFQARLLALVRSRLSQRLARRVDADDIVLSAYRSFFIAARGGRVQPTDADDLWPFLVTVALRKLAHQARRHSSAGRSVSHEEHDNSAWLQNIVSNDPTPDQAASLADELRQLCLKLDPMDREVLTQTLQGMEVSRIAADLKVHERTIRRALERIRLQADRCLNGEYPVEIIRLPRTTAATQTISKSGLVASPAATETFTYDQLLLENLVGIGAFSKVYRAFDRSTNSVVAAKFLKRDCWNDARAVSAIVREWEALRTIDHPNVLPVRGWGRTRRGALFLVTDFVDGSNLDAWRRLNIVSAFEAVKIVTVVADAIAATHRVGILHCDLKPSNILRRNDGQLIVCDFGLARWTNDPDDVPRGGTAGFLCPEQITDIFGPVTEQSDVYGLGGLLYALLTGHPPISGRDVPETIANVLSLTSPRPPSLSCVDVPIAVDSIVLKCLKKEPADRFGTVLEVAQALNAAID